MESFVAFDILYNKYSYIMDMKNTDITILKDNNSKYRPENKMERNWLI